MGLSNAQRRRKMEEERRKATSVPIKASSTKRVSTPNAVRAQQAIAGKQKTKIKDEAGTYRVYSSKGHDSTAESSNTPRSKSRYVSFTGPGGSHSRAENKSSGKGSDKVERAVARFNVGRAVAPAAKNPKTGPVVGDSNSPSRNRLYQKETRGAATTSKSGQVTLDAKSSKFDSKSLKQPLKQLARETVVRGASKLVGGKFGAAIDLANRADQALKGATGKSLGDEYKSHQKRQRETAAKATDYMKKKLKINR